MKIIKYVFAAIIISSFLLYNCGGNNGNGVELTQQQEAAQALNNGSPWSVVEITQSPDNVDVTALNSLQLVFNITGTDEDIAPSSFSASGADDFISTSTNSSWSWSGSGISTIALNDVAPINQFSGVQFSPGTENTTSITLSFDIPAPGGRTLGLTGQYTIVLEPN